MNSQNTEAIKAFVRHNLGCACPDEVFSYIDCQDNIKLNDAISLAHKINIGHRLLIYVLKTSNGNLVRRILPGLVRTGKNERDRLGFNRLRLVIATDQVREIEKAVGTLFENLDDRDDRVHWHVVSASELRI